MSLPSLYLLFSVRLAGQPAIEHGRAIYHESFLFLFFRPGLHGSNSTDFRPTCRTGSCTAQRWTSAKTRTTGQAEGIDGWTRKPVKAYLWRWIDQAKHPDLRVLGRRQRIHQVQVEVNCRVIRPFWVIWPLWPALKPLSSCVTNAMWLHPILIIAIQLRQTGSSSSKRPTNSTIDRLSADCRVFLRKIQALPGNESRLPWLPPRSRTSCQRRRAFWRPPSSVAVPRILFLMLRSTRITHRRRVNRLHGSTSPQCPAMSAGDLLCRYPKTARQPIRSRSSSLVAPSTSVAAE